MKISVVGSINMDQTVTAERIPLKGETLHGDTLSYIPGGKGANQAVAMARLGADVEMFGCVGDDSHGQALIDNLTKKQKNATADEMMEYLVDRILAGYGFLISGRGGSGKSTLLNIYQKQYN